MTGIDVSRWQNDVKWDKVAAAGVDYKKMLANNDSYHALQAVGGLIITGPTGTNVNDVAIGLYCP